MKKVFKTIFIYLGVLLLALLATVIFCAGFLFFYRDGNIFGIKYINSNEIIYARENEDMDKLTLIEVNSADFDVNIRVNKSVDTLMGAMKNDVFGYVKKSTTHGKFVLEYNENTKTAVFESTEPKGWINKEDAYLEIGIPESWAEKGFALKINTQKGDISIGGNIDWTLGNLEINTTKGNVYLKNITLDGDINLNLGKGKLAIDKECSTVDMANAEVRVGSGTVDFGHINVDKFNLGVVEIKAISKGQVWIKQAEELITDGNINGGGEVEVANIGFVDFASLDTNIKINNITKSVDDQGSALSSRIKMSGQGKVFVNNANCNLEVNGDNGKIEINTATGTLALSSNQGDISVTQALKLVSAVSQSGNISIKFSTSALNYQPTDVNNANKNRAVIATTKNGNIVVEGLQNANIVATGTGGVSLKYDRVAGDNNIETTSGAVNIVVPNPTETTPINGCAFNLYIDSNVNTDIKVGVAGSIGGVDFDSSGSHDFINIYNSATSTSNNLNVKSTTGKIKVRSADLVDY